MDTKTGKIGVTTDNIFPIFGSHAYAVVAHGKGAGLFVDGHAHVHIVECAFVFAER